ncbi:hypothetical protein SAMN05660649_00291 [Desulfotomaculum arcticum]|uniref:Uncharacterized protein n=1 Tax=Desulfotruncus arcticus DSM 17038 TaxID=1121424 RepID=A0A1I2N1D7_9FIRM|nr:hypothetical protein [Desulfotruncus arcticus]SFF97572.1 hypothetical protein SAMN05660649_00291 [Desulfotomaculum arcticum] [Desulfotruncus arcticus DSM 17038]
MKVILENELEKCAWEIMMAAQHKWKRNYGSLMCDHLDFYFEDIYKEEADKAVNEEVERRLRDEFGEEFFVGKDEYVKSELEGYALDELTDEERQELEREFCDDYKYVWEQIEDEREYLLEDVRQKLRGVYYTFFNGPQRLTIVYNGEVIQGGDAGQECEA